MKTASQAGQLLVAGPELNDPNFYRSVVLVFQHDDEGAAGLILNRELPISVGKVAAEALQLQVGVDQPLFWGGPVEGPLMALHTSLVLAELQVSPGLFFSMQRQNIQSLLERGEQVFRMFTGYSGWGAGQLEAELAAGGWLTLAATPEHAFGPPEPLWRQVCEEIGRSIILPRHASGPRPPAGEWN
jgi:putative transcriptional regulator